MYDFLIICCIPTYNMKIGTLIQFYLNQFYKDCRNNMWSLQIYINFLFGNYIFQVYTTSGKKKRDIQRYKWKIKKKKERENGEEVRKSEREPLSISNFAKKYYSELSWLCSQNNNIDNSKSLWNEYGNVGVFDFRNIDI